MKVFCTGMDGYIGRNLTRHLQNLGYFCVGYDIFHGYDIQNISEIRRLMVGCNGVIHLASLPSLQYCEEHPEEAVKVNVFGTINVVRVASEYGIPMVFISTFAAKNPRNIYGLTKRLGEKIVLKRNGVVLRASNVYGGIDFLELKSSVMANFISAKREGKKVTIYGDGSDERDFVHIDDVCRAIIDGLSLSSGLYEVCMGKQTSILELAKSIGVEFEFGLPRDFDVKKVSSDSEYRMPRWKWQSQTSLKDGIEEMLT